MTLSVKARKRWSLLVLLIGLPAYIIVAMNLAIWLNPSSVWVELLIYVVLGVVWIVPLKRVFLGVGQPEPEDRRD